MMKGFKRFVYRNAAIYFAVLTTAAWGFGQRASILAGLLLGLGLGVWRFKANSSCMGKNLSRAANQKPLSAALYSIANYMFIELAFLLSLYIAMKTDKNVFKGFIAGNLIIPLVFFINGITECTGITHHHFYTKVSNEF
jgi:fatty-acid desaturase